MRTTTRSSNALAEQSRSSAVAASSLTLILTLPLIAGCVTHTEPAELFDLRVEMRKARVIQTRVFKTPHEHALLSASIAVLQDLGFQIEESQPEVGFLRATKEHSTAEGLLNYAGRGLSQIPVVGNDSPPGTLYQDIVASLVARPISSDATRKEVRITFYRIVWRGGAVPLRQSVADDTRSMEMIRDPEIYQQFFTKLTQAVFLEANRS